MTLDTYTLWTFVAGVLTGIALALLASGVSDQVFIVRYLRQRRRRPIGDPTSWIQRRSR